MSDIEDKLAVIRSEVDEQMTDTYPDMKHDGKKLRGMLPVIIGECFNGDRKKAIKYGASVEFLHQGSIVHDDILDEHTERRENPTKVITDGIKKSLLIGDMYFTKAIKLGAESGSDEAKAIARAMETVLGGAIEEISMSDLSNKILSGQLEDSIYYKMIDAKTAALFGCASHFGAMSFTDDVDIQKDFFEYGMLVGRAYQIADDLCDMIEMADGMKEVVPMTIIPILPAIFKYNKDVIKTFPLKALLGRVDLISLATSGMSSSNMSSRMLIDIENKVEEANKILARQKGFKKDCLIALYAKYSVNKMLSEAGESI
ncbi:MAG: polyprenyl synthetase family protein [Gammaproteobacteria bacterium]|nr:polyprenyl synthetase family protein [Gammaproteobacteria bacterium]